MTPLGVPMTPLGVPMTPLGVLIAVTSKRFLLVASYMWPLHLEGGGGGGGGGPAVVVVALITN